MRERMVEGLFIAPALVLTLVVFVGTMVWTVGLSFTSSRAGSGLCRRGWMHRSRICTPA